MGWETQKIGDVLKLEYGKPLPKEKRSEDGAYVAYGANGGLCRTNEYYWDKPSIIVGRKGSAGEINLTEEKFWPLDVTYFTVFDDQKYDLKFLYYCLAGLNITSLAKGVKPGINRNDVYVLEAGFPPLPEQKRIVAILDEALAGIDAAIANTEQNLANARALFESYLNGVFAAAYDTGSLAPLSEIATDITDGDHMPPPKAETGVPFITIRNINKNTREVDFSDTFKVPREYFQNLKVNKRPSKGDVLYTVTGSFGIPVLVENDTEFCFQRHIGLIRPKSNIDSRWLNYLLLSPQVFQQANDRATGTAQKTVSLKVLRNFTVPVVPLPHQCNAVTKLDALSSETKRLETIYQQKLDCLAELKQAILHKAFAGELSALPEKASEEAVA